eukprot:7122238-Pyramimonas_sp.AAC.1
MDAPGGGVRVGLHPKPLPEELPKVGLRVGVPFVRRRSVPPPRLRRVALHPPPALVKRNGTPTLRLASTEGGRKGGRREGGRAGGR